MQERCPLARASAFAAATAVALIAPIALAGCTISGSASDSSKHTLVVAEWNNGPAIAVTKQIDAQFEKAHPGVSVELKSAPTANGAWNTLLNTQLAAKSVDVMASYALGSTTFPPSGTKIALSGVAAQIAAGQITDLTGQPFMKDYDPTATKVGAGYHGRLYGVPAAEYVSNGGVWYKPDLLAKYHLPVPATYSQFVADLKALKSHGVTPIFVAGKDGLESDAFNGLVQQLLMRGKQPGQAPQLAVQRATAFWNGTQNWTDPVYQTAASEYAQIMRYVEPGAAGVSEQTAPGVWAAKADDYAFFLDGSWDGTTIGQANPQLKYGLMALPGTNDASANRMALTGDLTWFVPTWAPQKRLALDWLAMFSRKSNYQKWLTATGSVSTQPGLSAASLPWMSWQNQHASTAFSFVGNIWAPNGASPDASRPDLSKMQPFGSRTPQQALAESANAYRQARGDYQSSLIK